MDPNEYTLTVNGLNIEPAAVTGLVDIVDDSVGYINATFNTTQLDFEIHADDEVILHGPTKQVP